MNDLVTTKLTKKKASFLKIYIKSGRFKLNMIPIPLFFANWTVSFIIRLYRFSLRFQTEPQMSKDDINEILQTMKKVIKEIRNYPPFDIVEIENTDTKILIKTK